MSYKLVYVNAAGRTDCRFMNDATAAVAAFNAKAAKGRYVMLAAHDGAGYQPQLVRGA